MTDGRIAGAGLDVIDGEPPTRIEDVDVPNLIVTCHAAFYSPEGLHDLRRITAELARAALLGEPLWNVVNGV